VLVVSVQLRNFRTYAHAEAHLGEGLTVVHGPNGSGKSNLLEALYFGCTGYSQRTRSERELVRFGAPAARVAVGLCGDGHRHELAVGFQPGSPKHMTVDGAPTERLTDVEQRPLVSVFSPDRLELLKGAPTIRRAHLDQLVAALWPPRAASRRDYSRALAQRNALIASIRAGRASRATLPSWDLELARHALALRDDRARVASLLAAPFAERAAQLGLCGTPSLEYRPRSKAADEEGFVAELEARLTSDLERGFSTHGPHRDELAILRDGRELRSYGSQGEQRLSLLALLLAERSVLARERDHVPLMLLDDVMSELDVTRRELLSHELCNGGQSVVATTDLAHVPGSGDASVTRLRISPGAILQEAIAA
jgi:DNA replication and repair protein RecF